MRSKISIKKSADVSEEAAVEEWSTRRWVNVVRIGPEFGRGEWEVGGVGVGGEQGEDRTCASRLKAGSTL